MCALTASKKFPWYKRPKTHLFFTGEKLTFIISESVYEPNDEDSYLRFTECIINVLKFDVCDSCLMKTIFENHSKSNKQIVETVENEA